MLFVLNSENGYKKFINKFRLISLSLLVIFSYDLEGLLQENWKKKKWKAIYRIIFFFLSERKECNLDKYNPNQRI